MSNNIILKNSERISILSKINLQPIKYNYNIQQRKFQKKPTSTIDNFENSTIFICSARAKESSREFAIMERDYSKQISPNLYLTRGVLNTLIHYSASLFLLQISHHSTSKCRVNWVRRHNIVILLAICTKKPLLEQNKIKINLA